MIIRRRTSVNSSYAQVWRVEQKLIQPVLEQLTQKDGDIKLVVIRVTVNIHETNTYLQYFLRCHDQVLHIEPELLLHHSNHRYYL